MKARWGLKVETFNDGLGAEVKHGRFEALAGMEVVSSRIAYIFGLEDCCVATAQPWGWFKHEWIRRCTNTRSA